ncbi:hypothetical protein [Pantoea sp. At-9b]|uniref:hypothetical protein n=1 Tax=Pantoea sp. (strain At-9b) TaxID=592316 RepID=UPI0001B3DEAF|nr:hypothetical protein [Pantoea sp. At-9b]ADU71468.1 conserved hypothetical protein [Pantoea sp. At-9b]
MLDYWMIKITRFLPIVFFLISMMVTASDSENLSVYSKQLKAFYQLEPPCCLGVNEWPVSATIHHSTWENARLLALVDAGLVEIIVNGEKRYFKLTTVGQKNFDRYGDLCYGRVRINNIQKIEPTHRGETNVYFTIRLIDQEEWATNINLRTAFSELDLFISGAARTIYRATFTNQPGKLPEMQGIPEPEGLDY